MKPTKMSEETTHEIKQSIMMFKVVCPTCLRIYAQPIPITSKEDGMTFKCDKCDILLVRFFND